MSVAVDVGPVLLRIALGGVMFAHGYNHLWGPGGLEGTAKWFGSMGLRPAKLHALASGWIEVLSGLFLGLGLLTSLMCAAVVGVMTVAFITAHRTNGFFIFQPGQGWEYVAVLASVSVGLASVGPGRLSLDRVLHLDGDFNGGVGLVLSLVLGLGGAAALLATSWRPSSV